VIPSSFKLWPLRHLYFGVSIEDIMGLMSGDFSSPQNGRMAMFFTKELVLAELGFWFGCLCESRIFIDKADFPIGRFSFLDSTCTRAGLVIVILVGVNAFQRT